MASALPKVLLVEDHPDDEFMARAAVTRSGLKVNLVVAHDGKEAVAMLAHLDEEPPQLVLMDMKLPYLDGAGVVERLRSTPGGRDIPVVFLSNSHESQDVARAYRSGANGYVRKSVDFSSFCGDIAMLLQYWLVMNLVSQDGSTHAH